MNIINNKLVEFGVNMESLDAAIYLIIAIVSALLGGLILNCLSNRSKHNVEKRECLNTLLNLQDIDSNEYDEANKTLKGLLTKDVINKDDLYVVRIWYLLGEYKRRKCKYRDNYKKYLIEAISCYDTALEIADDVEYYGIRLEIYYSRGLAFFRLSEIMDKKNNLKDSILSYERIIESISPENNHKLFLSTQCNLGNDYSNLADVENRKENLSKAIVAYREVLKFSKIDTLSQKKEDGASSADFTDTDVP